MIRYMLRWLARRRLPAIMRHGTPREGGRGTLAPRDDLYPFSGHLERTAALGCGFVVTRPGMMVRIENVDGPAWVTREEWEATKEHTSESQQATARRIAAKRGWSHGWSA